MSKLINELENINLIIDEEVIDLIVEKAFEYKLGARGLRSICESILIDYMFELPSKEDVTELHISLNFAKEKIAQLKMKSLKAA